MRPRQPFPDHLRRLALQRGGVLVRGQLVAAGLADSQIARLIRDGLLVRVDRGVFALGPRPPDAEGLAWAATLLGGHGARLLGASALAQLGLVDQPRPLHVAVPAGRVLRDRDWVRFLREQPGIRRPVSVGRPPRTLTEDAILDFAGTADATALTHVVTLACLRHTTPTRLRRALEGRPRVAQRRLLTDLVAEVVDGIRSPLELRWAHDVERPHGLPRPERNRRLTSGRCPDVRYDAYRVLIELDGQAYHREPFRDWQRDNGHGEDGWLTLRYGWRDVIGRPCATAGNAARVLSNRGWDGTPQRCPRCPPSAFSR